MDAASSAPAVDGEAAYRALCTRDARFDGRFFVGVTTTGIYCRPICPARTPRRANCRFYADTARAEGDGFRPCLRCRPELAPGLSRVDSPDALAHAAAALLRDAVHQGQALALPRLAARLGVTDRHLRRIFRRVHGVGLVDYLTTQRLLLAKRLLSDTRLPVTEVALACGFGSLRRFQAVFAQRYRMQARALRRAVPATPAEGGATTLRLAYRPPYDVQRLLGFLSRRELAGVEQVDTAARTWRHVLTLPLPQGSVDGWVALRFATDGPEVLATVPAQLVPAAGALAATIRQALDLDADPLTLDPALDEAMASLARRPPLPPRPGLRIPGSLDGFETAVRVILGQQVSVAAARTLAARLVQALGRPVRTPWLGLTHAFPDAATLSRCAPQELGRLGIVRQRVTAIQALARAVMSGELRLDRSAPLAATLDALRALPGVGEWTVQVIALRALAWPDAWPAQDLGLRRALGSHDTAHTEHLAQAWRPWRSYAVMRLWQSMEEDPCIPNMKPERNLLPIHPGRPRREGSAARSRCPG